MRVNAGVVGRPVYAYPFGIINAVEKILAVDVGAGAF